MNPTTDDAPQYVLRFIVLWAVVLVPSIFVPQVYKPLVLGLGTFVFGLGIYPVAKPVAAVRLTHEGKIVRSRYVVCWIGLSILVALVYRWWLYR